MTALGVAGKGARVLFVVTALLPAWAWACPSCAGRDGGGGMRLWLVGGMIATPFLIAAVVLLVLRKLAVSAPGVPPAVEQERAR